MIDYRPTSLSRMIEIECNISNILDKIGKDIIYIFIIRH